MSAGAPISWGVCEVPGWGHQLDRDRGMAEMRQAGLTAPELGPLPRAHPADPPLPPRGAPGPVAAISAAAAGLAGQGGQGAVRRDLSRVASTIRTMA